MNKIINVGLIGFGLSGKRLVAPFIHVNEKFNLKYIYTRNRIEDKGIFSYCEFVNDYNTLLQDNSLDLIFITTPNTSHFELAKKALENNKDVVVEKPVTPTIEEANELKRIAGLKGRKVAVYHNRRWDSCYGTLKKVIKSGVLGELKEIEMHWERYEPYSKENWWRSDPLPGGGVLYDLGPHFIDQAIELFGFPNDIYADVRAFKNDGLVDDYFDIFLYYNTFKVRLRSGIFMRGQSHRYIAHGSEASFFRKKIDPQGGYLSNGILPKSDMYLEDSNIDLLYSEKEEQISSVNVSWMEYYDILYNSLTNRTMSLPVSIDDGITTLKIIEKAFESSKKGLRLRLNN